MGDTTNRLDAWLVRLQHGDDGALNELILYFQRRLEGLARKMLKGFPVVAAKEQTVDVLQEALIHLPTALRSLVTKEGGPAGAKTFKAADLSRFAAVLIRRELIDLANRHRQRLGDLPPGDARKGMTWNPARLAEWTEFHEIAAKLPQELREVFDLLYYGGLKQEEAAALLGVSDRTVRTRWQDARRRLIEAFGGKMPGS